MFFQLFYRPVLSSPAHKGAGGKPHPEGENPEKEKKNYSKHVSIVFWLFIRYNPDILPVPTIIAAPLLKPQFL